MHGCVFVGGQRAGDQCRRMHRGYDTDESGAAKSDADSNTRADCVRDWCGHSDSATSERVELRVEQQRRDNAGRNTTEFRGRYSASRTSQQQRDNFLGCSIREWRVGLGRAGRDDGDGRRHKLDVHSATDFDDSTAANDNI